MIEYHSVITFFMMLISLSYCIFMMLISLSYHIFIMLISLFTLLWCWYHSFITYLWYWSVKCQFVLFVQCSYHFASFCVICWWSVLPLLNSVCTWWLGELIQFTGWLTFRINFLECQSLSQSETLTLLLWNWENIKWKIYGNLPSHPHLGCMSNVESCFYLSL